MPIVQADYSNLNHEEMAASIGLKPKHIPMLIGSFLDEAESILKDLSTAIESKNFDAIKLHAHSIKGSSGNLKFTEIYEMTKEMELSAAEANASFDYKSYLDTITEIINTIPK